MKTPISSKKPQTRNIKLSDGTVVATHDNKKSNLKKGKTGKHIVAKTKFSTETGRTNDNWPIKDDFDDLEYPPPSTHPLFRKLWAESVDNITERSNFQPAHLGLLEALCRLRVELRSLDDFIMSNGHTFRVVTVLGEHRKTYPEVNERLKVLGQISNFSKLLDLIPKKDKSKGKSSEADKDGWG